MGETNGDRAVSATVGVVLLLAITIASVGVITAAAGVAMDDTRTNIQETAAENALYQYDAVVSEVAYGSADQRRVGLGDTGGGQYEIRPNAGEIRVIHQNFSGDEDELIVEETLGAFVYESGDTEIAAQGGAVFRRDGEGSVLLSAPQMRYADQTFTAPVVGLRNGGGQPVANQRVRALVSNAAPTKVLYPNRKQTYNGSTKRYANPVTSGAIVVEVQSDYYTAWASHFRKIDPSVNVTVDADANRATLVLPTEAVHGDDVPLGEGQNLRGIDENEHAINEMNITLPGSQSNWNSFGGASIETEGFRGTYTVTLDNQDGKGPCEDDVNVDVTAEYDPDVGTDQTWFIENTFTDSGGAFTYECVDGDNYELYANLTGTTNLTYESGPDPVTFDQHTADNDTSFTTGDAATIDFLTNHYVAMTGGNTRLEVDSWSGNDKGNGNGQNSINTDGTTGDIYYDSGAVITYLRVTNTTVNTTLN